MIFFLVKVFSEQAHADQFLQGKLYARRLSWFKKLESDYERGDDYEAASVLRSDGIKLTLNSTDMATGETENVTITGSEFHSPLVFKPEHFDHINIFCMYAAHSGEFRTISEDNIQDIRKQVELPKEYVDFGSYAVVIINFTEFLERVRNAAHRNGYCIRCSLVSYYDPGVGTSLALLDEKTLFAKRNKYAYQKEFRFAINTDTTGSEPITLDIGKIDDIAIRLDTSDINRQLSIELPPPA